MRIGQLTDNFICLNCVSHVSDTFRRTFGDEEGRVHRCLACDTRARILAWTLGAFFGGIIVWILYYFVRDEVGTGNSAAGSGI